MKCFHYSLPKVRYSLTFSGHFLLPDMVWYVIIIMRQLSMKYCCSYLKAVVNSHIKFLAIYLRIAYNKYRGADEYAKY